MRNLRLKEVIKLIQGHLANMLQNWDWKQVYLTPESTVLYLCTFLLLLISIRSSFPRLKISFSRLIPSSFNQTDLSSSSTCNQYYPNCYLTMCCLIFFWCLIVLVQLNVSLRTNTVFLLCFSNFETYLFLTSCNMLTIKKSWNSSKRCSVKSKSPCHSYLPVYLLRDSHCYWSCVFLDIFFLYTSTQLS